MASPRAKTRLRHIAAIAALLALVAVLGWLSTRYVYYADWTANNRNTLTAPSRRLLARMQGPVRVTVYAYPNQRLRKKATHLIRRYRRVKPDIALDFVNPATHPVAVRHLHIDAKGEALIRYQGQKQKLRVLNEQKITSALARLANRTSTRIVFLGGNGERATREKGQAGYSKLADVLRHDGLKVETLDLAKEHEIPADTSVLVLASPQDELQPGEAKRIRRYVKGGGNLLWLEDPKYASGLEPLAKLLGIDWQHGVIVYPDYKQMGTGHPGFALVTDYPDQPITKYLTSLTLFPVAQGVKAKKQSSWKARPLLTSVPRSYLETGSGEEDAGFQPGRGDMEGPLHLALALSRPGKVKDEPRQRVVVAGDSDFMANDYLGLVGNKQLAVNIFQWLGGNDQEISVHVPPAPDTHLFLTPVQQYAIWGFFVAALPLILVSAGAGRWWRRRRR
jgi:ABC-type uncharacterized transport system involved in gliding motility auxiliary subunit